MKFNQAVLNPDEFSIKNGIFCGKEAVLVTPALQGTSWTQENKFYRSSIWVDGELVSAGFPKFTNAHENPEHFPMPTILRDTDCVIDKIDGSLVICDYFNDQFSMRTRGTFSYKTLENAADFEYCIDKYPQIIDVCKGLKNLSLLFEITTPNQKIIIDYGDEPDLWLVGIIHKYNYEPFSQKSLDQIAPPLNVKRPKRYTFNSIQECSDAMAQTKGIEGVILYSGDNHNTLHKIKTEEYVKLHRFKSNVTFKNLLEVFIEKGKPSFDEFKASIIRDFDWECCQMAIPVIEEICNKFNELQKEVKVIQEQVEPLKSLERRDAALNIQNLFGDSWKKGVAFSLLSGRVIDDKTWKKLILEK